MVVAAPTMPVGVMSALPRQSLPQHIHISLRYNLVAVVGGLPLNRSIGLRASLDERLKAN